MDTARVVQEAHLAEEQRIQTDAETEHDRHRMEKNRRESSVCGEVRAERGRKDKLKRK